MKCPKCNSSLKIASSKIKPKRDWLPFVKTQVFNEITLVCINPKCENYSGTDLNNPQKIVTTVRNKVN